MAVLTEVPTPRDVVAELTRSLSLPRQTTDLALLRLAAIEAATHLTEHGVMIQTGDNAEAYDVIARIAERFYRDQIADANAVLERIDDRQKGTESAQDAACERWRPEVDAAYYFGLAVGLQLALASSPAALPTD